jgi:chemotaxis protein methyltransferase CheR
MTSQEPVSLTDEEVASLTHAILKRHGIDFTCYEPKSLKRRITRAISVLGFTTIHELWVKVLRDPHFIYSFMDEISVGLTSMFRDPLLWTTLKNKLPQWYVNHTDFQIWHAGCSTGEEVFTMGVLLKEVALLHKANALATDISLDSISTARKGEYHQLKLAEFEKNYSEYNASGNLNRYYQKNEQIARFESSLINHVDFRYHNLITDHCKGEFDIILCRNVMIYFDNSAKVKLMERFHKALKPGGLFIIGFYDAMLPLVNERLFEVIDLDAKIFRKKC